MTDLQMDTTKDARLCAEVVGERDALRAMLMTLADIATEAACDRPTYDFKARAASAANEAHRLLVRRTV